jgi:glyoxylase-like metal-dependent hydrolase (beta-lactamase superfamily II)
MDEFRKWRIGDVTVTRVIEVGNVTVPVSVILPKATAADVTAEGWLSPNYADEAGNIIVNFQGFLIEAGGRKIMVDTCIGEHKQLPSSMFDGMTAGFLEKLERAGAHPDEIDIVLCTHLHFDHVGWNTRLVDGVWAPSFKNARYLFARTELEHALAEALEPGDGHIEQSVKPILAAGLADIVETDAAVCEGVRLEPSPGHTPGHVCVWVESRGQGGVITGDCIHHPLQMARLEFSSGFDTDSDLAVATRRTLFGKLAGRPVLLIGTHFCEPTAGYVAADGAGFRLLETAPTAVAAE